MGSRKSKVNCPQTELTCEQINDISQQTNLSENEIRCRHSVFLEQYPEGIISRQQLYDSLHEVWPEGHIDKFAAHLFDVLDKNHNGSIDFAEFIVLSHKLDLMDNDEPNDDERIFFGLIFDMFDRNHNGYLEKNELKPMIESIYDLAGLPENERRGIYSTEAQVKYILKKLDKNGDKRLSRQEFIDREKWINDERLTHFLFNY